MTPRQTVALLDAARKKPSPQGTPGGVDLDHVRAIVLLPAQTLQIDKSLRRDARNQAVVHRVSITAPARIKLVLDRVDQDLFQRLARILGADYFRIPEAAERIAVSPAVEDATRLSFQDSSFDLVVSQNVFHHLKNWPAGVSEIARVLRSGGFLLWLDLAFPKWVAQFFQPLFKNHSLYCIADVKYVFGKQGFNQRFHERRFHGPISQHHVIWQKSEVGR